MNLATLTWLTLGACLVYVVAQDPGVYEWLALQSKLLGIWFQRQWFLIRHNPDSFWVRYEIKRNSDRMAEEFIKQYKQEQENGPDSSD
jgi:hypothetical protein